MPLLAHPSLLLESKLQEGRAGTVRLRAAFEPLDSCQAHNTCSVSFPQMNEGLSQNVFCDRGSRQRQILCSREVYVFWVSPQRPCLDYNHGEPRLLRRRPRFQTQGWEFLPAPARLPPHADFMFGPLWLGLRPILPLANVFYGSLLGPGVKSDIPAEGGWLTLAQVDSWEHTAL